MRRFVLALLAVCLCALPVRADEPPSTAASTERGRSLDRILDILLLPEGKAVEGARTLLFLVDATPSLKTAGFEDAFAGAMERARERLGETQIAVVRVGTDERVKPVPATRAGAVEAAMTAVLAETSSSFQNVYADVRRSAAALKRRSGRRDLVLVTLENGDGEDDVEGTLRAVRAAGVTLQIIAREAFLSDTYWLGRPTMAPRGAELAGSDAAFVELPWGFLWQQTVANEAVASGFPMFGLSRLASGSGGRVWLYYPPSSQGHQCMRYGGCLFCRGDHLPTGLSYRSHRLKALAPAGGSRAEAYKVAARDPLYRAVLNTWERASKKGLVRSRPSVKRTGSTLQPERRQLGRWAELSSSSYASLASRAERMQAPLDDIIRDLEAAIARVGPEEGSPRYRAIAETTLMLLRVTRVNFSLFVAFCREVAPIMSGRRAADHEPPEIPFYRDGERFVGIGYSSMSLCHGVAPFYEVFLPGGDAVREELRDLEGRLDAFYERYAHTPFAAVLRTSGLARFSLTVRGKYVPPPKRDIPGSTSEETTTKTDRPTRGGSTTGGSGGGPASGGD
jgi:hypothetical protein